MRLQWSERGHLQNTNEAQVKLGLIRQWLIQLMAYGGLALALAARPLSEAPGLDRAIGRAPVLGRAIGRAVRADPAHSCLAA